MGELYIPAAIASSQTADTAGASLGLTDSTYNRLLRERIIWLGSKVHGDNTNTTCAQMLLLAVEDPERGIYLCINSPGGSVTTGMAVCNTIQYAQSDIATVAAGLVASIGQHLLSAGAKGKHYLTPRAHVLMHQPSDGARGSAADIRINADLIIKVKQELTEITAANTGYAVEETIADSDRDHWFSAQEALECGFIDHTVRSGRETGKQNRDN